MSLYQDLNWAQGKKNLPGLRGVAYFINKKDIVKWPVLTDEGETAAFPLPAPPTLVILNWPRMRNGKKWM